MRQLSLLSLAAALCLSSAAPAADEVSVVPGFNATAFKVYSGYITVKGPFQLNDYDELKIHYQLELSQGDANTDPLVTWHQGGPGGSSFIGAYTEMGYFQVSDNGPFVNDFSWNKYASMLYLESPAGSSDPIGFSMCYKNGAVERRCEWNDRSQAEAYARTLQAFYEAFPEFKARDLYLTGESYAGQYIPNIATFILKNTTGIPLKGIAVGNGCWGGTENSVSCNGPNSERNDVDLFFGKGLMSKELRDTIYKTCGYDGGIPEPQCATHLLQMDTAVGPHNVYDIYDNCPEAARWYETSGRSPRWLRSHLRDNMNTANITDLEAMGGGYSWACGGQGATRTFFERQEVQTAMHLEKPGQSGFGYTQSGPASQLLYPYLVSKIRVLIYNGDADACVPYIGNEEWTTQMAKDGVITESQAWHPWYMQGQGVPAGYATNYNVTGTPGMGFTFITIRLAGHMVPTFQPAPALAFFERFIKDGKF